MKKVAFCLKKCLYPVSKSNKTSVVLQNELKVAHFYLKNYKNQCKFVKCIEMTPKVCYHIAEWQSFCAAVKFSL